LEFFILDTPIEETEDNKKEKSSNSVTDKTKYFKENENRELTEKEIICEDLDGWDSEYSF
jgi:hypothetical protein